MYQVDFVAALFGAFLLLWISKAGRGLSFDEADAGIIVLQAWCPVGDDAAILPIAEAPRCASTEIVAATNPTLYLTPCRSMPLDTPALTKELDGEYRDVATLKDELGIEKFPALTAASVVGKFAFFDADMKELSLTFGGFATSSRVSPITPVAVGFGPATPPVFVSIDDPSLAILAVNCRDVPVLTCGDGEVALYRGPYTGKHNRFTVRIRSDEWPEPCLENANVYPNGTPHLLHACNT